MTILTLFEDEKPISVKQKRKETVIKGGKFEGDVRLNTQPIIEASVSEYKEKGQGLVFEGRGVRGESSIYSSQFNVTHFRTKLGIEMLELKSKMKAEVMGYETSALKKSP